MNADVYDKLVSVAKQGKFTTYAEIGRVAELDVANISELDALTRILEEIAEYDRLAGRPQIIALVIREDLGMPAKGFFKYAKSKGIQARGVDDVSFFADQVKRVYETWKG